MHVRWYTTDPPCEATARAPRRRCVIDNLFLGFTNAPHGVALLQCFLDVVHGPAWRASACAWAESDDIQLLVDAPRRVRNTLARFTPKKRKSAKKKMFADLVRGYGRCGTVFLAGVTTGARALRCGRRCGRCRRSLHDTAMSCK